MDNIKFEYIRSRRKRFTAIFLLVIIFGSILFLFSRHAKFQQKVETEEEETSTMNELYRKIITEEMDAMEAASKNILDEPLFVDYRLSDDTR